VVDDLNVLMQDKSQFLLNCHRFSDSDFLNHNLDLFVHNVCLNDVFDVCLHMNFDLDDSLLNSLGFEL